MRKQRRALLSEINVVPYIDVMLVLLVVFMVAAPLMVQGILINLPETKSEPLPRERSDPLIISLREDGVIFLETVSTKDLPLDLDKLSEMVTKIIKARESNFPPIPIKSSSLDLFNFNSSLKLKLISSKHLKTIFSIFISITYNFQHILLNN